MEEKGDSLVMRILPRNQRVEGQQTVMSYPPPLFLAYVNTSPPHNFKWNFESITLLSMPLKMKFTHHINYPFKLRKKKLKDQSVQFTQQNGKILGLSYLAKRSIYFS